MVEGRTGNTVLGWNLFTNPSLGPAAFLRVTHNSRDKGDGGPLGPGWSVAPSTLNRLGRSREFGAASCDCPARYVRLVDGDGTGRTFRHDEHAGRFVHPPGLRLHLERTSSRRPDRAWLFTRPDRTQFF